MVSKGAQASSIDFYASVVSTLRGPYPKGLKEIFQKPIGCFFEKKHDFRGFLCIDGILQFKVPVSSSISGIFKLMPCPSARTKLFLTRTK